jgi:hypothetical protein
MHPVPGDFGYFDEGYARVYDFYNFQGYPSLFMDGVDLGPISNWRPSITSRMATPSPITLTMGGNYDAGTNNGTINASFRNDSTAAITAGVYFVITEDSLYHVDPNGHAWHNHLARDFLPDEFGELVTINPGDSITVSRDFTINTLWDENRCYIVTWIQADAPSRNGYQAGEIEVMNLIGVEEITDNVRYQGVTLVSNPCTADNVRFSIALDGTALYRIEIFDVMGRRIKTITGITSSGKEEVSCNLNRDCDTTISSGVYFYRFSSQDISSTGKIVLK